MSDPFIFIGIPSGSDCKMDFALSLAGLVAAAANPLKTGGKLAGLRIWNTKGSILSRSRNMLATNAIKEKATHLLFLDSDMTFPNYTVHQLLSHDKDIVAANCVTKTVPAIPTARYFNSESPAGTPLDSRGKKGLEKVWRVGTGVMLVKIDVFKKLPQPWFPITWNEENEDYTGEDWNFCELCQQHSIDIYVDHALSQHIGHIGSLEYDITWQEGDES